LTGRGSPWLRGLTCGLMTTLGGLGHTMPYLVPDSWPNAFWIATAIACVVVFFELWAIAFIRARYMDTPFLQAVFQIVLGGVIVCGPSTSTDASTVWMLICSSCWNWNGGTLKAELTPSAPLRSAMVASGGDIDTVSGSSFA